MPEIFNKYKTKKDIQKQMELANHIIKLHKKTTDEWFQDKNKGENK